MGVVICMVFGFNAQGADQASFRVYQPKGEEKRLLVDTPSAKGALFLTLNEVLPREYEAKHTAIKVFATSTDSRWVVIWIGYDPPGSKVLESWFLYYVPVKTQIDFKKPIRNITLSTRWALAFEKRRVLRGHCVNM